MTPITREDLEWYRSPEATKKGVSKEKIEAYEKLWRRREKLEEHIREAFSGCTLGDGIGLFEADAWDLCIDPEEPRLAREKDERENWQSLTLDDLTRCYVALNFTDAAGYRFLLPAFMLVELDDYLGMTLIHLSGTKIDSNGRRNLLSCDQVGTVIEFLELYLDDPESSFFHESITESLEVFWRPLLKDRQREAE